MKKINLKVISEILSEKELKNVMGGSGTGSDGSSTGSGGNCSGGGSGSIVGYSCNGLDCFIDIRWADGTTACDCPMPTVVCTQAGLTCY